MLKLRNQTRVLLLFLLLVLLVNCAALKNFRTSREAVVDKPPYYHGRVPGGDLSDENIGHLPVSVDIRISRQFDTDGWDDILGDLNTYLRMEKLTVPLEALSFSASDGPDMYIGSPGMFGAPINEFSYDDREDDIPPMVVYSKDPTVEWKNEIARICADNNLDYVIVLYLGLSEYMVHQKNWLGGKEIALGTGYKIPVKWLTSLEDPVEVFHITGALISSEGKIKRMGAEGILAAKTASFFESIIGLQNALSDETISKMTTEIYRKDLPGKPLAFKVALQNLVAGLTGRKELLIKPKK